MLTRALYLFWSRPSELNGKVWNAVNSRLGMAAGAVVWTRITAQVTSYRTLHSLFPDFLRSRSRMLNRVAGSKLVASRADWADSTGSNGW